MLIVAIVAIGIIRRHYVLSFNFYVGFMTTINPNKNICNNYR